MHHVILPSSPLSDQPPERLYGLGRDRLLDALSDYFQAPCPPEAVPQGYTMWRCSETGLEFAQPQQSGNEVFYHWIGGFPSYYPQVRWEYFRTLDRIKQLGVATSNLLDVGCGDGKFLCGARLAGINSYFGLDFNRAAVAKCSKIGIPTFGGSLKEAMAQGVIRKGGFAYVTSFHCLEHVENPISFVEDLLAAAAPAGRVFLSTPASPMSFEEDWFDVMNHPPHHLTRWNLKSYLKLAETLGLQIHFFFPRASFFSQSMQAMKLKLLGPRARTARLIPNLLAPRYCLDFQKTLWRMWRRSRRDPWKGADVVLVELKRK